MNYLEFSVDFDSFLFVKQKFVFVVKVYVLVSYLNVCIFNEDVVDGEVFMVWLEEVFGDLFGMVNYELVFVVFKFMVLLCKVFFLYVINVSCLFF